MFDEIVIKVFVNCSLLNLIQSDIFYVPINFSLRFCQLLFSKSHITPDVR